jgi:hypothetical protein
VVDHPRESLPPVIASGRYGTKPLNAQSIQKRFPSVSARPAVSAEKALNRKNAKASKSTSHHMICETIVQMNDQMTIESTI